MDILVPKSTPTRDPYLIVNVSDVHHIVDVVAKVVGEHTTENVKCNVGPVEGASYQTERER